MPRHVLVILYLSGVYYSSFHLFMLYDSTNQWCMYFVLMKLSSSSYLIGSVNGMQMQLIY